MADLYIAGVKVAPPAELDVSRYDLTKASRTASGRMVMEVIRAGVRRVDVVWRYLPDPEYKRILDILAANKPFFTVTYEDAGGLTTMTAYVGDINAKPWLKVNGVRYWAEVKTAFIEQ